MRATVLAHSARLYPADVDLAGVNLDDADIRGVDLDEARAHGDARCYLADAVARGRLARSRRSTSTPTLPAPTASSPTSATRHFEQLAIGELLSQRGRFLSYHRDSSCWSCSGTVPAASPHRGRCKAAHSCASIDAQPS